MNDAVLYRHDGRRLRFLRSREARELVGAGKCFVLSEHPLEVQYAQAFRNRDSRLAQYALRPAPSANPQHTLTQSYAHVGGPYARDIVADWGKQKRLRKLIRKRHGKDAFPNRSVCVPPPPPRLGGRGR